MLTAELLQTLAAKQKLSHAYLFSGNDSAKKLELVANFLSALNIHIADQIKVRPVEGTISISKIRKLSVFLQMSAWDSQYKVVIVEDTHTMNKEAQSAFLKLLEEPKGDTIFFLLTEYADLLLHTILSRSQEFKFYSYADMTMLNDATIEEFEKLRTSTIATRFLAAKNLAETPIEIQEKLQQWLVLSRKHLLKAIKENSKEIQKLVTSIKTIQEVLYALKTSNVNPRLALERLMLD